MILQRGDCMKIRVLGSGLMGKEAARDLVTSSDVVAVGITDLQMDLAKQACDILPSSKVKAYQVDATDTQQLSNYMKIFDVIINALFYSFNEQVARTATDVGVHAVDLGGHNGHVKDKVLELHNEAADANVTIIPDLGVAPGMINILTGYGASKLAD